MSGMNAKKPLLFAFSFLIVPFICLAQSQALKLWYDKPAQVWEETLPLGNGHLGMMPDGGLLNEKIVLNDITLWSGARQDANNYEANKKLPEIRKLLAEGKNPEAQALIDKDFICTGKGSAGITYGCYQTLGKLNIRFNHGGNEKDSILFENYERELSLNDAIAKCKYKVDGITYTREYFTSFGDDVDVIRLSADKPGKLSCSLTLSRPERGETSVHGNEIQLSGRLDNGIDGNGMQYIAKLTAQLKGGSLTADKNALVIKNATEIIIYIAAGTDFKKNDFSHDVQINLNKAVKKTFASQKKLHINKFQKFFNRVTLNLGEGEAGKLSTDKRLKAYYQNPQADNGLPVLFYQFGRYLSISSTRVGLLPPNLQGLWANGVQTPWNGDYHLDVNVQMNHWPVEAANLSEFNLPLTELVKGMVANGEKTAKAYYSAEGWVAHVITNVWGFTEPGESASWGATKVGSGWLCNNLWEHYSYTNDINYLRYIYPILKGAAQFYNSLLIEDTETGWLVSSPSSSPENTFFMPDSSGKYASICNGPTIDNQIIRELFANVVTAAEQLRIDEPFRNQLIERTKKLPPVAQISADGRIMEWLKDYKETEPQHRHISHLYGLFPASLITPANTPELAEACKKTLEVRGDDGPSWSIAYKILFWARLGDGNRAFKLLQQILRPTTKTEINYAAGGGVYPNLLSAGPPFQIDGNFGATAGIGEMLMQCHDGFIELIPAIPDEWKAFGEVSGLKAKGNFTVDFKWVDGKVTNYRIASPSKQKVKVKVNGLVTQISTKKL